MFGVVVEYVDTVDVMPIGFDNLDDAITLRNNYVDFFRENKDEWAKRVYVIHGERVEV